MKKGIIALSIAAAFVTTSFAGADADMATQLEMLKKQIAALEAKLNANTSSISKVDKLVKKNKKKIKKVSKKASTAKMLANNDNLKFSVDFRTAVDKISYKMADGTTKENNSLMTNRLWLKGAYAPSENVAFYSILSYNKAYGDSANHSQTNTNPGYANFDWVTNENATDNTLKVKEAYWLYMNDTFLDSDMSWTASVGRRPSTDGLGINLREDQKRKSALSHTVNVEFDGASLRWNLDKVTPMEGSWFKICMGRGLTNATQRFTQDGSDYAEDETLHENIDMVGFIFVPYDDGQYSVHTNYAKASNMIGFNQTDMQAAGMASNGMDPLAATATGGKWLDGTPFNWTAAGKPNAMAANAGTTEQATQIANANALYAPTFKKQGDLELATIMFKSEGLGDGINDFLDDTIITASFAKSKAKSTNEMLGLAAGDSKTGHSEWLALNMPAGEGARFGIEWNKGSKYWRSMTYGEDTMIGSKIATRGTAWEIYYNKNLTKALSASIRYTDIDYDYTGSNGFFGSDGAPITIAKAKANFAAGTGGNVVDTAKDIRLSMRYRF